MKKFTALVLFCLLLIIPAISLSSQEIRVGLMSRVYNSTQVTIGADTISVGFEVNGVFTERAIFHGSGFSFTPSRGFFVRVNNYLDSFGTATVFAAISTESISPTPCYIGNGRWVLKYGPFDTYEQAAAFAAAMQQQSDTSIVSGSRRLQLNNANGVVALFDSPYSFPQVSVPGAESFFINGGNGLGRYRGRIELGRFTGNNITGVNILCVEEYLYSVVPAEMPHAWHTEALKAQAIASRTFAAYRMRSRPHAAQGFDLCDRVCCQVYGGVNHETEATTSAVRATHGLMMFHNNLPIFAAFSSSSGGHTDNSENVWFSALPYLRGVPDPFDTTGAQWTRTFTYQQLTTLAANGNHNIGNVTAVSVNYNQHNRAQELILTGTLGTATIRSEAIRSFFSAAGGSLQSRNFVLEAAGIEFPPQTTPLPSPLPTAQPTMPPTSPPTSTINVLSAAGLSTLAANQTILGANDATSTVSTTAPTFVLGANWRLTSFTGIAIETLPPQPQQNNPSPSPQPEPPPQTYPAPPTEPLQPGTIRLTGRGNGHGVGMSQHGARGMAEAGYTYRQILLWYFTGVEIR